MKGRILFLTIFSLLSLSFTAQAMPASEQELFGHPNSSRPPRFPDPGQPRPPRENPPPLPPRQAWHYQYNNWVQDDRVDIGRIINLPSYHGYELEEMRLILRPSQYSGGSVTLLVNGTRVAEQPIYNRSRAISLVPIREVYFGRDIQTLHILVRGSMYLDSFEMY